MHLLTILLIAALFAVTQSVIDLAPILNQIVVPILVPIVTALAGLALAKIAQLAHFNLQDGQRALVLAAVDNAIAFAEQKLAGQAVTITADQKIAAAVNYLLPKIPQALSALKITPAHLGEIVAARIPQA